MGRKANIMKKMNNKRRKKNDTLFPAYSKMYT